MEAAGLAIGIAGLVGLFNACKEAVEQVDSFRHFGFESRQIMARFDADKFLFQRWADHVGITNNKLKDAHHTDLDKFEVALTISRTLSSIQEILKNTEATSSTLQLKLQNSNPLDPTHLPGSLQKRPTNQGQNFASVSKTNKISWALGKKTKFSTQVEFFEILVGKLYSVVPIPEPSAVLDPDLKQWIEKFGHSLNGISDYNWF